MHAFSDSVVERATYSSASRPSRDRVEAFPGRFQKTCEPGDVECGFSRYRPVRATGTLVEQSRHRTFQPAPTGPRRRESGIKRSVKNTSLNSAAPVICRSGRTSMPGLSMVHEERRDASCWARGSRFDTSPDIGAVRDRSHTSARSLSNPRQHAPHGFSAGKVGSAPGSLNSWQGDEVSAVERSKKGLQLLFVLCR